MKKIFYTLILLALAIGMTSCSKEPEHIGGDPSDLGEEGITARVEWPGMSNLNVGIVSVENGISELAGTFDMTEERYLRIFRGIPKGYFEIDGTHVKLQGLKLKFTTEGIENVSGYLDGILVKFDAKEGDTYDGGRKVTHVSEDNDYQWFGMKIKVIEVECPYNKDGAKNYKVVFNHRFGIVGMTFVFDDGTVDNIPIRLS